MKLFYRGVGYEYSPSNVDEHVAPRQTAQFAYRGVVYPRSEVRLAACPAQQTVRELSYRGTTYSVSQVSQAESIKNPSTLQTINLFVAQVLTPQNVAKVHYANMLENLQHRLAVARASGNQTLIGLLKAELQQINSTWGESNLNKEVKQKGRVTPRR